MVRIAGSSHTVTNQAAQQNQAHLNSGQGTNRDVFTLDDHEDGGVRQSNSGHYDGITRPGRGPSTHPSDILAMLLADGPGGQSTSVDANMPSGTRAGEKRDDFTGLYPLVDSEGAKVLTSNKKHNVYVANVDGVKTPLVITGNNHYVYNPDTGEGGAAAIKVGEGEYVSASLKGGMFRAAGTVKNFLTRITPNLNNGRPFHLVIGSGTADKNELPTSIPPSSFLKPSEQSPVVHSVFDPNLPSSSGSMQTNSAGVRVVDGSVDATKLHSAPMIEAINQMAIDTGTPYEGAIFNFPRSASGKANEDRQLLAAVLNSAKQHPSGSPIFISTTTAHPTIPPDRIVDIARQLGMNAEVHTPYPHLNSNRETYNADESGSVQIRRSIIRTIEIKLG